MPTYSSHPSILLYAGPASRQRATIDYHLRVSPSLLRSLTSCLLFHKQLCVPPHSRTSTFLLRCLAVLCLPLSAFHRMLLVTHRRLSLIFDQIQHCELGILSSRRELAQPSHKSRRCVFTAYAHTRHLVPRLHPLLSDSHPWRSRSSCFLHYWYPLIKISSKRH